MATLIQPGSSYRIETDKHVIEIADFQGVQILCSEYYQHPALRFERYDPPHWGKGQGNTPIYHFHIETPEITVREEDDERTSYFVVEIGGQRYLANVSGGGNSDQGDGRPRSWGSGYLQIMRPAGEERWRGVFGVHAVGILLRVLGQVGKPLVDPVAAAAVAEGYAREKARHDQERQDNVPKGLVTSAVNCPDGRTFVWTTRGNYYLPPGAYRQQWDAGLTPNQRMTIEALRARGIECTPSDAEHPNSEYGRVS